MLPTRERAEEFLIEAEKCNPGAWGNHSRVVVHCAEKNCTGMQRFRF